MLAEIMTGDGSVVAFSIEADPLDRCPLLPMLAEIMTTDGSVVSFSIEADPHESMTRPIVDVAPSERML